MSSFFFKKYDIRTNGKYPKKVTKKIIRPTHMCCFECKQKFTNNDSFHYTENGPIHGWGEFSKTGTCQLARTQNHLKSDKKSTNNLNTKPVNKTKTYNKVPYKTNKCMECGKKIEKYETYHNTVKGSIHGEGFKEDYGTCVYKFRQELSFYIDNKATEYVEGQLDDNQMLKLIEEITNKENGYQKYCLEIAKAVRESKKTNN